MVLSNLMVKGLYGNYDYDVHFNQDITLIYGTNGCGKTTILNMITSIITGSVYKLLSYRFEEIILDYYNENNKRQKNKVVINKKSQDNLEIMFQQEKVSIARIQIPEERRRRIDSYDEVYFEEYPILKAIREEFNYVYLALNRSTALSSLDEYSYISRRRFYLEEEYIIEPERIDPEIRYVENLINRRYINATATANKINNEFRDAILKSALDVNIQTDLQILYLE